MKKYVFILVTLIVTMFAGTSFAFSPPQPNGFVTDASGKLSSSEIAALNAKCQRINTSTGNEIAILVVPSLGGSSIEDAAQDTWSSWKIGKGGLDNGVLLMLAMNEHKSRIQTGKGVEGDLPDLKTQDILIKMRPFLRNGNLAGALNFGVDQISATLESRKGQKTDPKIAPGATFDRQASPTVPMQTPSTSTTSGAHNASCDASGIGLAAMSPVLLAGGILLLGLFLMRRAKRRAAEANRIHQEELAIIQQQRKLAAQQMEEARKREARLTAEKNALPKPTLSFPPQTITRNNEPIESDVHKIPKAKAVVAAAGIVAAGVAVAAEASKQKLQRDEEARRARARRDEEDHRARQRRDDEDRKHREDSSSSYSSGSSSSWDSGGGSGGGFGGGDSGGGGSSSDW